MRSFLFKNDLNRLIEVLPLLMLLWIEVIYIFINLPNSVLILFVGSIVSIIIIYTTFYQNSFAVIFKLAFRYRWIIAFFIFVLLVSCKIHGSSIGKYDDFFQTKIVDEDQTILGISREHSDEYPVSVIKFLSQSSNGFDLYSQRFSISPTNMVLDYYSPVLDWTIIGKPLSWGFILRGNERGLSWYWCGMNILIFMYALEMSLVITNGRKPESILGAVMIVLSPSIQWWLLPHMPIVILYAMSGFCSAYWFLLTNNRIKKYISSIVLLISIIGFALSIFPMYDNTYKGIKCKTKELIMLDLQITSALLLDLSTGKETLSDVGIRNGRIDEITKAGTSAASARFVLDA